MKSLTKAIIGLGAIAVLAGGCTVRARGSYDSWGYYGYGDGYVEPQPVYVNVAPPQAYVEVRTAPPRADYTWIDGNWHWSGSSWVWFRGRWEAPRVGYAWVGPSYHNNGGRYQYVPGYWSNGPRVRTVDSYPTAGGGGYGNGNYSPPPPSGYGNNGGYNNGGYTPPATAPAGQVYVGGRGNVYTPPPPSGNVQGNVNVYVGGRGTVYTPPPPSGTQGTVYTGNPNSGTVYRPGPPMTGTVNGGMQTGTVVRPPPPVYGTVNGGMQTGTVVNPGGQVVPGRVDTGFKKNPFKGPPPGSVNGGTVNGGMQTGTVVTPGTAPAPAGKAKPRGKSKFNFGR